MQIIFTPQARSEIVEASLYYESCQRGLGSEFEEVVAYFVESIAAAPELPRLRKGDYRRVNLKRFPYYITYSIESAGIWILAIGHGARRPEYWVDRKQ